MIDYKHSRCEERLYPVILDAVCGVVLLVFCVIGVLAVCYVAAGC